MSAIRVRHGSADVELTSDDYEFADGSRRVRYVAADLIAAVVQALRAIPDGPGRYDALAPSEDWLAAIENGAASRGLEMPS